MARKRKATDFANAAALRVDDAATATSLGTSVIRQAIKSGELAASKLGPYPRSPLVITRKALDDWLESKRIRPEAAA